MTLIAQWKERSQRTFEEDVPDRPYSVISSESVFTNVGNPIVIQSHEQLEQLVNEYQELQECANEQISRVEGGGRFLQFYLLLGGIQYRMTAYVIAWVLGWEVIER